jgi:hypothetical protein
MNAISSLSMVGLDPTTQWPSPAFFVVLGSMPTTAVQMLSLDQVWVVGSSPTMENWGS